MSMISENISSFQFDHNSEFVRLYFFNQVLPAVELLHGVLTLILTKGK